jgi:hypothetical protein
MIWSLYSRTLSIACRYLVWRLRRCKARRNSVTASKRMGQCRNGIVLTMHRCFLFLVNYARMKPEVAMKALPMLVIVCPSLQSPDNLVKAANMTRGRTWRIQILVRALALRTLSYIHVREFVEATVLHLSSCSKILTLTYGRQRPLPSLSCTTMTGI